MLKNKKVILALVPILLFGGYTMTKAKPVNKDKIKGTIYLMPKEFLVNLRDGHYAKISVALELAPGQSDGASADAAAASSGESAVGTLPEEPLVRELVTNALSEQSGSTMESVSGRRTVKREIVATVRGQTDVKVEGVYFPDVTVQ